MIVKPDLTEALGQKFAFVNATGTGDTVVVAAVAGKVIRILSFLAGPVSAPVNISFKSVSTGAVTSTKTLAINQSVVGHPGILGHFQTAAGEALAITLSGSSNVGVDVVYILI